jgi:hypothetical protein
LPPSIRAFTPPLTQADRQRKAQLSLLRLVKLAALEAPSQKMEFGLRHRSFETQQQAVVEVARVVRARILIPLFDCQLGGRNR